jgi:ubiquinone/menaquinone biosynthesis C-methylase UbiE/DNA-binding transcriptional ArsR family regulator
LTAPRGTSNLPSGLTDEVFAWMADLNEPLRARLLRLVELQELNVGEISNVLQLPQSTTSRHLKLLSDDAWLTSRREGTSRLYRLAAEQFSKKRAELWGLVRESVAEHAERDSVRLRQVLLERQEQNQAFFAGAAGHWDRLRAELFGTELERRFLPALISADCRVLDLGCGTGRLSEAFAPFAQQVIAVDASAAMVEAAQLRLAAQQNTQVRRAQLHDLPLPAASIDLALIVLVLHYVSSPADALREVARVLAPGGKVLLVDLQPHAHDEYRTAMGQLWLGFPRAQLTSWLEAAGLCQLRYVELPPDPNARGPGLLVCMAHAAH